MAVPSKENPLGASARTIAIGDIHGCSRALQSIIDAIDPQPEDELVFLGDMIDRGPDSRGVVDQVLELQSRCRLIALLGNHEEMMLSAGQNLPGSREWQFWVNYGGVATLESYGGRLELVPAEHIDFLFQCRSCHETDTHLFFHANYVAELAPEEQPQEHLRWMSLSEQIPVQHTSGKIAVVGHTAQHSGEILDLGHLICVDTYCYGGGWLTALDVQSKELWQADREGNLRES